ncbi:MAG: rRNA maturation RNase YbeY [Clostridia bacterium]|nr:rRNA maturation RNase YbeY [Clostridia bacterium]
MHIHKIKRIVPTHKIVTTVESATEVRAAWLAAAHKAIRSTLAHMAVNAPISVELLFVDGEAIQTLNRDTRKKDAVTDVLSFPALAITPGEQPALAAEATDWQGGKIALGSIVICTDRALAQAEEYGHSPLREFAFLAAHSVLHLLGYDHETSEEDEKQMFALQAEILKAANILR